MGAVRCALVVAAARSRRFRAGHPRCHALAAAQSVPFLRRRQQPAAVLALAGAALAVKYAAGLNIWSAGAAVLAAAYGLGAYGSNTVRRAAGHWRHARCSRSSSRCRLTTAATIRPSPARYWP
jgi:hypothetical protein